MNTARVLARSLPRQQPIVQRRFGSTLLKGSKAEGNAFIAEREAVKKHAAGSSELWRKMSLYGIPPVIVVTAINAYNLWNEHWEHWDHMTPLEERTEYSYQNLRTKNFFFGDGDKSLFWNPKVNYHKTE